nr:reverse transcriptase domain-containing protein [Tanacetum cinerariifolium]
MFRKTWTGLLPILRQELPSAFTNYSRKVDQEKVQQEKLKAVKARLNFEETSQHSESRTPNRIRDLKNRLGSRHARSETRGRVRSHTRTIQGVAHTTVAVETLKAATRVLAQEKQSLLPKDIITKEHPHEGRKCYRKEKIAHEEIRSQGQRGTSRVLRATCLSHRPTRVLRQELASAFTNYSRKVDQEKVQQEKLKAVKARLNFEETSQHSESRTPNRIRDLKNRLGSRHARGMSGHPELRRDHSESPRKRDPKRKTVFKRLEKRVLHRLGDKGKSTFAYSNDSRRRSYHSSRRDTESCYQSSRSRETENTRVWFDDLPKESIDSYDELNEAFLENYLQQKNASKIRLKFIISSREMGNSQRNSCGVISFPPLEEEDGAEGPMIIEAEIGGHFIHRMYVDEGSSSKILYEHCFNIFRPEVRSRMIPATTSLVEFSGEIILLLGQISLLVKIGDGEHSTSAWMNFMVVRSPSPYNGIIGRPGVRRIQEVPSTTNEMLKFLVAGETVAIHPEYLEQTIAIGSTLTEEGRKELCALLRPNLDIFAWRPADMTGVLQHIAEYKLSRTLRGGTIATSSDDWVVMVRVDVASIIVTSGVLVVVVCGGVSGEGPHTSDGTRSKGVLEEETQLLNGSSLIPPAVLRVLNSKACRGSCYIGSTFSIRFKTKHDGCGLARVETVSNGMRDNDEK